MLRYLLSKEIFHTFVKTMNMKKGISLLLIITQVLFLNAQSLVVTGDTYFAGDLVTQIAHHLDIKNTSTSTITVECQKTNLILPSVDTCESFYCFAGNCYSASSTNPSSSTDLLPGQQISFANSDADAHSGYYDAYGASGIAEVKYCFYDVHNPSDQTCVTITYDVSSVSGLDEINKMMSDFYPNPAQEIVYLDYYLNKSANLIVMDILGNEVKTIKLSERGTQKVDISDFSKGIYFGNVVVNNEIVTIKKIIVR